MASNALRTALSNAKRAQCDERLARRRAHLQKNPVAAAALRPLPMNVIFRPLVQDDAELRKEVLEMFPPKARALARADPREK
jgi:hypothetical protein